MRARRFAIVALAVAGCVAALGIAAQAAGRRAPDVLATKRMTEAAVPGSPVQAPAAAPAQCVAPPDQIRRTHPDLLKHQRDLTVRQGIRGEPASLKTCIACHAAPEHQTVTAALTQRLQRAGAVIDPARFTDDQGAAFCQTCHAYAAVQLDCFECHARAGGAGMAPQAAFFGGLKR